MAKLNSSDRLAIRKMRWQGAKMQNIANRFGVSRQRIQQICFDVVCPVVHRGGNRNPPTTRGLFLAHSPERAKEIIGMYGKVSASQIAKKFNLASRNVVIGIWNRARANGLIQSTRGE